MTTLLIDIGNSRLKWADCNAGQAGAVSRGSLAELVAGPAPCEAWISCVGSKQQLIELQAAWPLCQFHLAASQVAQAGVINGYRQPAALGVDRWLALLAARQRCRAPQLVVDAGTALTIDLLDEFGQHKGGWIVPGYRLLRQALAQGTVAVRAHDLDHDFGFGRQTSDAVNSGCSHMLAGAVAMAEVKAAQLLATRLPLHVVVSGGDGQQLVALGGRHWRFEEELVIQGLALLKLLNISPGNKVE